MRSIRRSHRRRAVRLAPHVAGITAPLLALVLVAGCLAPPPPAATALPQPTAAPSLSGATELTRFQVEGVLKAAGFGLIDVQTPYRPGESPALALAPRTVVQVVLQGDPANGQIVIYEFQDPAAATAAGREMAAYLGSGPGRVQFPPDSQFVLRQVGSTLVFYQWSPANTSDPKAGDVPVALEGLGQGIPVPR